MPFSPLDVDIVDTDILDLGGVVNILFWAVHLDALGGGVSYPEGTRTDYQLRAGWVSLGDHFSAIGGVDRDYWRAPDWLNFPDTLWTPNSTQTISGVPATTLASRLRYSLSPGTSGHIFVLAA